MDPNANLKEQLELATEIQGIVDQSYADTVTTADKGIRLAELVLALNEWISKGGFLPAEWQKPVAVQFPVIFELEPIGVDGGNEATNPHWYCSDACRKEGNPVDGSHPIDHEGAFAYGDVATNIDGLQCECCGKDLEPANG